MLLLREREREKVADQRHLLEISWSFVADQTSCHLICVYVFVDDRNNSLPHRILFLAP